MISSRAARCEEERGGDDVSYTSEVILEPENRGLAVLRQGLRRPAFITSIYYMSATLKPMSAATWRLGAANAEYR
jgi:hypothetical protein